MESAIRESIFESEIFDIQTKTIVVIDLPWSAIPSDERVLLNKILTAVKLNLDAVRIVEPYQIDWKSETNPTKLISFGWNPENHPLYEVVRSNGHHLVISDNLNKLMPNDESKKRLWQALKKLFTP